MAENAPPRRVCERSKMAFGYTGAITSVVPCKGKKPECHATPISFKSIEKDEDLHVNDHRLKSSQELQAHADMQKQTQLERMKANEKHLHWLQDRKVLPWDGRAIWSPIDSKADITIESIRWGQNSPISSSSTKDETPDSIIWDELNAQAFEHALVQSMNGSSILSHIELEVQGLDANSNRLRVQRTLSVQLKTTHPTSPQGLIEKTTMHLTRTLKISAPDAYWLPPAKPQGREVYQCLLEQIAQHEVDKAFDERNHYLREVYGQDVDHVRTRRESTIPAHEWEFQLPEICVRGEDGTMIALREKRVDYASGDEVVLTHTVVLEQVRDEKGGNHLFDLPSDGCESERRIRNARRSISSAIDKCLAPGSAERFMLDRWVDGTFFSRD